MYMLAKLRSLAPGQTAEKELPPTGKRYRTSRLASSLCLVVLFGMLTACGANGAATTTAQAITSTLPAPLSQLSLSLTSSSSTSPTAQLRAQAPLPPFYENRTGPLQLLKSYYNAVNRKEYHRAYSYWETPGTSATSVPPDFTHFVQGYATTASVTLITGTPVFQGAAGSTFATVPISLTATHTDGSIQSFYGRYVTRHTNPGIDPNPAATLWRLFGATIKVAAPPPAFYENRTGPVQLLKSYYNAVNRKEYHRAYSYWETPGTSATSVPPDFTHFVQGYATTASVTLITGTPVVQGAAGSTYGTVETVLIAMHTDGTTQRFYGCYLTRHTNPGIDPNPAATLWRLFNATIKIAPASATNTALLAQGCKP